MCFILLARCDGVSNMYDNQFGFRKGHSTDLVLYVFKQVIDFDVTRGSPVLVCFLDAQKAFDRVNKWMLLKR